MPADVLPDDKALREARRQRAFDQMDAYGIDVLVLGREANARYVSGAPRLWTAGTRPFGPGCVVVRATEAIHLVSTWDEGIPDDIPHENLFGITWNPGNLLAWLQGIDGTADARRVGTDSLTPRFEKMLPEVFPNAELIDAEPALQGARRVKAPEEIDAIRTSIAVAERALAAAVAEVRPGVSERHLTGVFMDAMARSGVTTPATQRIARMTTPELVAFDAGVVAGGYIGEVGRTCPTTADAGRAAHNQFRRAADLRDRLLASCRPGATGTELLAAYDDVPTVPIAYGLGLGFDVPVVTAQLPKTAADVQLEPGMVLAVVAEVGPIFHKDVVLITTADPEVLTTYD